MEIGVLDLDSLNVGREWIPLIHRLPTERECQFVDSSFWTASIAESGRGARLSMRTFVRGYWTRIDKNNGEVLSDDSFHYWLLEDMYAFPEPPMVPPIGDNRDLTRRDAVPLSRVSRNMSHYRDYDHRRNSLNRRRETYEWANQFVQSSRYDGSLREIEADMRALGELARQNPTEMRVDMPPRRTM